MSQRSSETKILIENKNDGEKKKSWFEDKEYNDEDDDVESSYSEWCFVLPCCMDDEESSDFGHHVSVFMVGLIAFATFFCVNLILILVFLLG
uniref:Transmembrane protein n=1 Tax=Parastrongyloides trichosuri TaxID=131310 RepID=A0A0N4Z4Y7_PARTI